ncbi:bifunctional diguanylate cyclase/phosphodiesterase [Dongshaea marina]|uniref:bifunctional diguanylate cyclase/phosphodiesterase n=1 Tax=Dongshaea marina TaxID=2047966 RepID=UPI000D3E18D7|nr:EAL domain-containing protein [Dongshaea marina]
MTLYKQILITMLVLFALLFAVAYTVQFQSTRSYLAEQQQMTVNNTSTSLGLALTPYLENGDKLGAESVINAVFDGGYYRLIQLDLLANNQTLERTNTLDIQNVPGWFIHLGLFKPMEQESILTSGWLQLGRLKVVGHPGQAYYELWKGMSQLLIWFVIAFVIIALILMKALKHLLRPLEQIREQASAIEHHHFGPPIPLPKTFELQSVVRAMNSMSKQLEAQFEEQANEAEKLREQAFRDSVSGLGNRAYFNGQLQAWIAEEGQGGVMLMDVDILEDLYRQEGFLARDQMVSSIAEVLNTHLATMEGKAIARISATEFAVMLPGLSSREMRENAQSISDAIAELVVNPVGENTQVSVCGIAMRSDQENLSTLLSNADRALQQARTEGKAVVVSRDDKAQMGRTEWKQLVQDAIAQDQFRFNIQPALQMNSTDPIHSELLTYIAANEQQFSAGQFMPAVEQFRIGGEFDRRVLELIIPELLKDTELNLAVNLSRTALGSDLFCSWLQKELDTHKSLAQRLSFELPESAIIHSAEHAKNLVELVRAQGFSWGVDQFGRNFHSLGYLGVLRPNYVKIDHSYTNSLLENRNDTAFLTAVCKTAHKVGALTIATRVENDEVVAMLEGLEVDGYQGFIQPPVPFELSTKE